MVKEYLLTSHGTSIKDHRFKSRNIMNTKITLLVRTHKNAQANVDFLDLAPSQMHLSPMVPNNYK